MEKEFLTVKETSMLLNIGKTKIYEYISSHELQSVKFGKSRRVSRKSIDNFINSRTAAQN
jgi:excisionase family DNA binding protein